MTLGALGSVIQHVALTLDDTNAALAPVIKHVSLALILESIVIPVVW